MQDEGWQVTDDRRQATYDKQQKQMTDNIRHVENDKWWWYMTDYLLAIGKWEKRGDRMLQFMLQLHVSCNSFMLKLHHFIQYIIDKVNMWKLVFISVFPTKY